MNETQPALEAPEKDPCFEGADKAASDRHVASSPSSNFQHSQPVEAAGRTQREPR